VYLIRAILKIRSFYKTNKISSQLSTCTLLLHSFAFGFYLLSDVLVIISYTIYAINSDYLNQYILSLVVLTIMSFIS